MRKEYSNRWDSPLVNPAVFYKPESDFVEDYMQLDQLFDTYDEFDLALALYHWLQHNWEGQSDPLYEAFCTLTAPGMYHPAHSETVFENLANTDDGYAAEIYEMLTRDNYELALNRVLNYESKG